MVTVMVLVNGLVHDGIVRKHGDSIQVTEEEAERLSVLKRVKPRPLLRALIARSIGGRHCAVGEVAFAPSEAIAMDYHRAGVAEWVNFDELGITLPPRKAERPVGAREMFQVRAVRDLQVTGLPNPNVAKGQVFATDGDRAVAMVRQQHVEPVDWVMPPERIVRFEAVRPGAHVGSRSMNVGETAEIEDYQAQSLYDDPRLRFMGQVETDSPGAPPESKPKSK
jgi:hypothetical protein